MDPIPEATVKIGENLSITVRASDADGESLTYSTSDLPSGASFDGKSGFFCWTPANDQEGIYTISFKVNDSKLNDSEVAKINVVKEEVPFNFSGKLFDIRLREASPEEHFSNKSFLDVGGMKDVGKYRDLIWFNISEFRGRANLSIRRTAAITGLYKDKLNRLLNSQTPQTVPVSTLL
jgi:hypothetical protein